MTNAQSIEGDVYVKNLSAFIKTNERQLANAILAYVRPRGRDRPNGKSTKASDRRYNNNNNNNNNADKQRQSLPVAAPPKNGARLSLTPHHLFYLLHRFEELGISVGPMSVRIDSLHSLDSPINYVSFLGHQSNRHLNSDAMSIRSVSSVRSVMSGIADVTGIGSLWNIVGLSNKEEYVADNDLKYIYSAFTKIPCLRLSPDPKARLIETFEEYPFDTAVPLTTFKNLMALEISDLDIHSFYGWDQLAERIRFLVVRRANLEDPADLLYAIVLDDMEKQRRRSSARRHQYRPRGSRTNTSTSIPGPREGVLSRRHSTGASQDSYHNVYGSSTGSHFSESSPSSENPPYGFNDGQKLPSQAVASSPHFPSRQNSSSSTRGRSTRPLDRSNSSSSECSSSSTVAIADLPKSKWHLLRHLSLTENGLSGISSPSFLPVADNLTSLDLSKNLLTSVPTALSCLTKLRSLSLAHNLIESTRTFIYQPVKSLAVLNLRGNKISSLAGIENLPSLERLDLRENKLTDPDELIRVTGSHSISDIWVAHNPFCRERSNYRITIFNLFRMATPGFDYDIRIDNSGPGILEQRSLVARALKVAASSEPVPVKPPALVTGEHQDDLSEIPVPAQLLPTGDNLVPPQIRATVRSRHRKRVVALAPVIDSTHSPLSETSSTSDASEKTATFDEALTFPVIEEHIPTPRDDSRRLSTFELKKRMETLKEESGPNWLANLDSKDGLADAPAQTSKMKTRIGTTERPSSRPIEMIHSQTFDQWSSVATAAAGAPVAAATTATATGSLAV